MFPPLTAEESVMSVAATVVSVATVALGVGVVSSFLQEDMNTPATSRVRTVLLNECRKNNLFIILKI
jgi:hypothetical protein